MGIVQLFQRLSVATLRAIIADLREAIETIADEQEAVDIISVRNLAVIEIRSRDEGE